MYICIWLGSFGLLANSPCFFPFVNEITFLRFVYSSCTPPMPLSIFFSSFDTFSSFHVLLQQLLHSTTMFPYACMGLLTIRMMWPVLYPSLYFSVTSQICDNRPAIAFLYTDFLKLWYYVWICTNLRIFQNCFSLHMHSKQQSFCLLSEICCYFFHVDV